MASSTDFAGYRDRKDPGGPGTRPTGQRRRPGLLRLMLAVAVAAAVLTLVEAAGAFSTSQGPIYALVGPLTVAAVVVMARDGRDLASTLLAIGSGVGVGWPLIQDACSPDGLFVGPLVGLLVRFLTRRGEPTSRIVRSGHEKTPPQAAGRG